MLRLILMPVVAPLLAFMLCTDGELSAEEIAGWGTIVNPDGDCSFRSDGGKLTITVAEGLHDLWPGRPVPGQSFNAPRVWQEVDGNFLVQVKVTADWMPYKADTNYGAGLVVWESETNLLRRERHVFMRQAEPTCFAKPLYLQNGVRVDERDYHPADYYQGRSTWLRAQRTGNEIRTAVSHDGQVWTDTGTLTTTFPSRVKVGVHAFKVSPGTFTVEFDEFRLTRGGGRG